MDGWVNLLEVALALTQLNLIHKKGHKVFFKKTEEWTDGRKDRQVEESERGIDGQGKRWTVSERQRDKKIKGERNNGIR